MDVDLDLLSHTEQHGQVSGLLLLEEISGAAFKSKVKVTSSDPNSHHDDDHKPRPVKRRKVDKLRGKLVRAQLVPELDTSAPELWPGAEEKGEVAAGDVMEDEAGDDDDDGVAFSMDEVDEQEDDEDTTEAQRILAQVRTAAADSDSSDSDEPDLTTDISTAGAPHEHVLTPRTSQQPPVLPGTPPPPSAWDAYGLHPLLLHALHAMRFLKPTPVQSACIGPASTQWKDVIAAAPTGSGKTLAFGLPILHHLLSSPTPPTASTPPCPAALILTPTRELALQVQSHLLAAARYSAVSVVTLTGGLSREKQLRLLSASPEVVVATPGRLWELIGEGAVGRWEGLRWLVLDEADRMVEKGHYREVAQVIAAIDKRRAQVREEGGRLAKLQHFFFSATLTLSEEGRANVRRRKPLKRRRDAAGEEDDVEHGAMVAQLAAMCRMQSAPLVVDLTAGERVVLTLTEWALPCVTDDKDFYAYGLVLQRPADKMIVFVNAISCLRRLTSLLAVLGLPVYPLHAEMQQRQRLKNLDRFTAAPFAVLVATDVAARGLDIPAVPVVLHYQLPLSVEVYIHRCGRVARGGREGVSVAMVGEGDVKMWRQINAVVRGGEDVGKWAVDEAVMAISRERMAVARKIDRLLNAEAQVRHRAEWFERKAAEMDIEVDDDVKEVLRKGRKGRAGGDDEDGADGRRKEEEVRRLRRELDALMRRRVEDEKKHARFFTLNMVEDMQRREEKAKAEAKAKAPVAGKKGAPGDRVKPATAAAEEKVKAEDVDEPSDAAPFKETVLKVIAQPAVVQVSVDAVDTGATQSIEPKKLGKRAKKNRRMQQRKKEHLHDNAPQATSAAESALEEA